MRQEVPYTGQELRDRLVGRGIELVVYGGNVGARSLFLCPVGHEWHATASDVVMGGTGCGVCAQHGFRSHLPSWIYILRHDEALTIKVGITNDRERRVDKDHGGRGWQSIRLWKVTGIIAQEGEMTIIGGWRKGA